MTDIYRKKRSMWHAMHRVCYGAVKCAPAIKPAVTVCPEWHCSNPNGLYNFMVWYEETLAVTKTSTGRIRMYRCDVSKGYNPQNCYLADSLRFRHAITRNTRLTSELVISARRAARTTKHFSVDTYAAILDVARSTLVSAITGRTWKVINLVEPPVDLKK